MEQFLKIAELNLPFAFLLVVFAVIILLRAMDLLLLILPNRIMRHWNIRKHGYPPPHCDADGDFREE